MTAADPLARLTALAVRLPDAVQSTTVHHPSFKVRKKTFALFADADRPAVWLKSTTENQRALIAGAPERFFLPPYLGPKGWVGVYLDADADWAEIEELVIEGYRLAAPKTLVRRLDEE